MGANIGDDFQKAIKYTRNKSLGGNLSWRPEIYKCYPSCKTVQLPKQIQESILSFTEVLKRRKSVRAFSTISLSEADLAFLLWAARAVDDVAPKLNSLGSLGIFIGLTLFSPILESS